MTEWKIEIGRFYADDLGRFYADDLGHLARRLAELGRKGWEPFHIERADRYSFFVGIKQPQEPQP